GAEGEIGNVDGELVRAGGHVGGRADGRPRIAGAFLQRHFVQRFSEGNGVGTGDGNVLPSGINRFNGDLGDQFGVGEPFFTGVGRRIRGVVAVIIERPGNAGAVVGHQAGDVQARIRPQKALASARHGRRTPAD